jgi:hypothetical protein
VVKSVSTFFVSVFSELLQTIPEAEPMDSPAEEDLEVAIINANAHT